MVYKNLYYILSKKYPEHDIRLIFASFLNCPLLDIYLHFDEEIKDEKNLNKLLSKYKKGYPLQYLLKSVNFLGLDYYIDERVLIPRFETEFVVQKVIEEIKTSFKEKLKILDIGTGSGVIALSLKKRFPDFTISALDISEEALEVASLNKKRLGLDINLFKSDIYSNVHDKYHVIISNPPYLDINDGIEEKVDKYEPHLALYAENKGLYYYEKMLKDASLYLEEKFLVAFEIGYNQENRLKELSEKYLPNALFTCYKDLNKKSRLVIIKKI